ncbi:MAG TPA: beta-propeller domain-containing protein [Kofleriaceae bacterium]|nr:beta-propeller domain-containing protein [Kofleriaceae bacterium]
MRIPSLRLLALVVGAGAGLAACADDDGTHVVHRTTELVQYQTCSALERDLKQVMIDEVVANLDRIGDPRFGGGPEDAAGDPAPPASPGDGRQEGVDYSGTNNQEGGVDEADFVKTDGYHVYTINGNRLHIFGVPEFGQLTAVSATPLEGHPRELLLDGDRVAVFSIVNPSQLPAGHPLRALVGRTDTDLGWYWRSDLLTKLTILDVADRSQPRLLRELYLEGYYQTGREVDGSVRIGAYSWINTPWSWWWFWYESDDDKERAKQLARARIEAMSLDDLLPNIYVRTPDGAIATRRLVGTSCRSWYRPTDSSAHGVTSILSVDLRSDDLRIESDHVITNYSTLYASTDTLVLTEAAHDWWWFYRWEHDPDLLNVHMFDIATPGRTTYLASGRVEGHLTDQFAIDEQDGYLRLATTTDLWRRWWLDPDDQQAQPAPTTHVWVLARRAGRLREVGHLGGIAPGERLFAARFLPDRAFLVTFEQIDPLFTIDLTDPIRPRLVGELEVPGFSTYLHPIAAGKLLSIGVGGDETGANWRTQVSLFDVSDMTRPRLDDTEVLVNDQGWGWSEALYEHKAFQYWAPKKLLAIPMTSYADDYDPQTGQWTYRYLSRLELVEVDLATGLSRRGSIDHSAFYNTDPDHYWYYRDIRRSIFMGDYVYAISDVAITVHRVSDLGQVAAEVLPGYDQDDLYWWW